MNNAKSGFSSTKGNRPKTEIVELAIPIEELVQARRNSDSPISLGQELFGGRRSVTPQQTLGQRRTDTQSTAVAPSLEITHPLLTFINDLNKALNDCSDQALRPMPAIGIINQGRQQLDLTELLGALEAGEKRLALLSHSPPTLDALTNTSRHLAHQAQCLVRALRRSFISQESDPAHPGNNKIASVLESVDMLYHHLHEIRLSFEDFAASAFLQARLESQQEPLV